MRTCVRVRVRACVCVLIMIIINIIILYFIQIRHIDDFPMNGYPASNNNNNNNNNTNNTRALLRLERTMNLLCH